MKLKKLLLYLLVSVGIVTLILLGPMGGVTRARFAARDQNVRWVSEDPEMWFAFTGNGDSGELTVDGETMQIAVGFTYGPKSNVWPAGESPADNNTLFYGDYSFGWNKLYIQVTSDKANIFGGELPKIAFTYQRRTPGDG